MPRGIHCSSGSQAAREGDGSIVKGIVHDSPGRPIPPDPELCDKVGSTATESCRIGNTVGRGQPDRRAGRGEGRSEIWTAGLKMEPSAAAKRKSINWGQQDGGRSDKKMAHYRGKWRCVI